LEVPGQQKSCLKKLTVKYILGLTIHQEVPELLLNNSVVWSLRQWTAKLYEKQQFETGQGQGFGLRIFSVNNSKLYEQQHFKVKDLDLEYFLLILLIC
jgi:hypothetical protein